LKTIIEADKRAMEERNAVKASAPYPVPDAERKAKLQVAGLASELGLNRAASEAQGTRATAESPRLAVSRQSRIEGLRRRSNQLSVQQAKSGVAASRFAPAWELQRVNREIGEVVWLDAQTAPIAVSRGPKASIGDCPRLNRDRNPHLAVPDGARFGEQRLDCAIVLVAANVDLSEKLSGVLADSDLALLHAQSKLEATALLERLKSPFDLAIVDMGLPDVEGLDLIMGLTRRRRAVRIIAATLVYSEPFARQIGELGVDAVVPRALAPNEWRQRVEAALAA
jgi:CheY-like chemotaxis protein